MTDLAPLLLLFACGWLLACLWLVRMGRLRNQLSRNEPAAYSALGKPLMRWFCRPGGGWICPRCTSWRSWGRSQGLRSGLF
jgi:hypothetical protein